MFLKVSTSCQKKKTNNESRIRELGPHRYICYFNHLHPGIYFCACSKGSHICPLIGTYVVIPFQLLGAWSNLISLQMNLYSTSWIGVAPFIIFYWSYDTNWFRRICSRNSLWSCMQKLSQNWVMLALN